MKRDLPKHLSYSQVSSLLDCGFRYLAERSLGAPNPPSWSLVGGSVVHSVTETMDLDLVVHGKAWNLTQIRNACDNQFEIEIEAAILKHNVDPSEWSIAGRGKEDRAWWEAEAPFMVKRWQDFLTTSQWEIAVNPDGTPIIEEDFENDYDYDATLVGGVDRVLRNTTTGAIAIVDLKTGSREPLSPVQLALYRDALFPKFGNIRWGYYYLARKGELGKPWDLDAIAPTATADIINGAQFLKKNNIFIAKPGMFCGTCNAKPYCAIMGGDPTLLEDK